MDFKKILRWLGGDGIPHIVCSALVVFVFSWLPLIYSVILAATVGLMKELFDQLSTIGDPSKKDLIFDVIGITIGVLIRLFCKYCFILFAGFSFWQYGLVALVFFIFFIVSTLIISKICKNRKERG